MASNVFNGELQPGKDVPEEAFTTLEKGSRADRLRLYYILKNGQLMVERLMRVPLNRLNTGMALYIITCIHRRET